MVTTLPVSQQTPVPVLPNLVNSASSALLDLFLAKLLPYPIGGAAMGYLKGKKITFTLCSTMQCLIWNYLTPYTTDAIFYNKYSNGSSKLIGLGIAYAAGIFGSYYLTKGLTQLIAQRLPSVEAIKEENKEPFRKRHAVYLSFIPFAYSATLFVAVALLSPKKNS